MINFIWASVSFISADTQVANRTPTRALKPSLSTELPINDESRYISMSRSAPLTKHFKSFQPSPRQAIFQGADSREGGGYDFWPFQTIRCRALKVGLLIADNYNVAIALVILFLFVDQSLIQS